MDLHFTKINGQFLVFDLLDFQQRWTLIITPLFLISLLYLTSKTRTLWLLSILTGRSVLVFAADSRPLSLYCRSAPDFSSESSPLHLHSFLLSLLFISLLQRLFICQQQSILYLLPRPISQTPDVFIPPLTWSCQFSVLVGSLSDFWSWPYFCLLKPTKSVSLAGFSIVYQSNLLRPKTLSTEREKESARERGWRDMARDGGWL